MTILLPEVQTFLTSLVGVSPARTRTVSPDAVLQRLRYTQGRTITQGAMALEQAWSEARLGLAGRALSTGVVDGLRVSVPDQNAAPGQFVLGAGRAIAPGGQDVVVHRARTMDLADIAPLGTTSEVAGPPRGLVALVLEPVVTEAENLPDDGSAQGAFEDPCPPDATTAPYLDIVQQDGARLGWADLDEALMGPDTAHQPNVAAEALRAMEAADPAALPWAGFGVPVVLMLVSPAGRILWHHHAAVARRGGMLPQAALGPLDRIRQSRVEGLIEETGIATRVSGWDGSDGLAFLRHLPPAGLLPRKAWDSHDFFPPTWAQAQAPIPRSQLDAALEAARAMAPYDTGAVRDTVKWLVPVPDHLYAPDLLEPLGAPDFTAVRALLQGRVADTLQLRGALRAQGAAVQGAIDAGAVTDFAAVDDDPFPGEDGFATVDPQTPDDLAGQATADLTEAHALLTATLFTDSQRALLDPAGLAAPVAPYGVTPFVTTMRGLIDTANDTVDFAFSRVQAEIYRMRQITLDNEEATKLATFPVLAGLAKGSSDYALSTGLRAHFLATRAATPAPLALRSLAATDGGGAGAVGAAARFQPGPSFTPFNVTEISRVADMQTVKVADFGTAELSLALGTTTALTGFGVKDATLSFGDLVGGGGIYGGASATVIKTLVEDTRAGLVDDVLLTDVRSKRTGILRAAPVPGDIRDIRSTTIADRLTASAALTAKASALRIKADILRQIQEIGISLDGLRAPLGSARNTVLLLKEDVDAAVAAVTLTDNEKAALASMRRGVETPDDARSWELVALAGTEVVDGDGALRITGLGQLAGELRRRSAPLDLTLLPALTLAKQLDPDPVAGDSDADDEAAYLHSAVATLESVVWFLRTVEARVGAITGVVDAVATRIVTFADIETRWDSALALAEQDLDEARHDLRVAESLIDEETARLAALQIQRDRILAEEVKFVAYTRPRALAAHAAGDTLGLRLPGAFEDPLPASLRAAANLPAELQEMIAALREMPIGWFASNPELSAQFTYPGYLDSLYSRVKLRAEASIGRLTQLSAPLPQTSTGTAPAFFAARNVVTGYRSLTLDLIRTRAAIDVPAISKASWADRARRALTDLSLNDLIEAGSQPAVAKRALDEIGNIERVLQAEAELFRQTPAAIRLLWAQALSVYDDAGSLRSLVRLPGWNRVDWALRRKLIRLNDWLFSRMEANVAEAVAVMSDLVRVAILLSAHAPVAEIVAARIDAEQTVRPGGALDLTIRRGVPRIGMTVSVMEAGNVRARGIVRDLAGSRAKVEMTYLAPGLTRLTPLHQIAVFAPDARAKSGA